MTDQQDLRARLPELPEPSIKVMGAINKNAPMNFYQGYTADQMRAYALEAAAQLGRVGEPVAQIFHECGGNHIEWIGIAGERDLAPGTKLYTSPQLPAGVPDGWALVPVKPTESMLEALGNTPWVIDGHTEGNTFIQKEYRDQRYVTDGWEAMLNAAPSPPATPQPDSAAPGGDVEQRAKYLLADEYGRAGFCGAADDAMSDDPSPHCKVTLRAIIAALSAPKQVGVAIGFRYRMKGHSEGYEVGDWHYNYHRDPDSFELRECEIETVWAGNASPQAAPVPVDGEPVAVTRHVAGFKPGPLFNQEEWDRLRSLPKGTKLYVSPPSQPAADWSDALEKATDRIVASRDGQMDVELEEIRSLARHWRIQDSQIGQGSAGNKARRRCSDELIALIDGAKAGEKSP